MTHDEARAELSRLKAMQDAAFAAAEALLAECARQGVPPPPRIYPPDADGDVTMDWGRLAVAHVGVTSTFLCSGETLAVTQDVSEAVAWLRARLGTEDKAGG